MKETDMSSFSPTKETLPAVIEPLPPIEVVSEVETFVEMLEYKRPAGSKAEKRFIQRFIRPLGAEPDAHGNYWVVIDRPIAGGGSEPSRVMWSSHTDTVHSQGGMQEVLIDSVSRNELFADSECLGADCTTGVWIMRQMILAKVPGVYVFHRAEECGGIGSSSIAKRGDKRLSGLLYAIAFDRRGINSIITHQWGGRCCSKEFAESLAPMLPGQYVQDSGGTFTDTANYTEIIPECTNISVGYYDQHTHNETQDLRFAVTLAGKMRQFDETRLVCKRDPSVDDFSDWGYGYTSGSGRYAVKGIGSAYPNYSKPINGKSSTYSGNVAEIRDYRPGDNKAKGYSGLSRKDVADRVFRNTDHVNDRPTWESELDSYDENSHIRTMLDLVKAYPDECADLLETMGYDVENLMADLGRYWRR